MNVMAEMDIKPSSGGGEGGGGGGGNGIYP